MRLGDPGLKELPPAPSILDDVSSSIASPRPPPQRVDPAKPEQQVIQSRSQVGRSNYFRNQWRPMTCRDQSLLPKKDRHLHQNYQQEGQLLYIALYRDKVAKQQAEIAAEKEAAAAVLTKKGTAFAAGGLANLLAGEGGSERGAGSIMGDMTVGDADALDVAVAAAVEKQHQHQQQLHAQSGPQAAASEAVSTKADVVNDLLAWMASPRSGGATSSSSPGVGPSARSAAAQSGHKRPAGDGTAGAAAPSGVASGHPKGNTTHIASVTANPTYGGATSEYLERKELSKLWEMWRAQQDEELEANGLDAEPWGSSRSKGSGRNPALSHGRSVLETPRTRGTDTMTSLSGLEAVSPVSMDSDEYGENRVVDEIEVARQRRLERMYNVITNPKVRVDSFARNPAETRARPDQSHIEGFPTLNLMRLYEGPWRLDV